MHFFATLQIDSLCDGHEGCMERRCAAVPQKWHAADMAYDAVEQGVVP